MCSTIIAHKNILDFRPLYGRGVLFKVTRLKYKPKSTFSGDLSVGTGAVPWTDLLMMDDVNKLVTELYGDSVENSSFFDDVITVKSIYGSQ